ncbi:DUF362 domain-containing protein [Thermodesulfobacteriota bacterium]
MSKVIFSTAAYEYNRLKPIIFQMIDTIGPGLITNNMRVLIKPNLLSPAKPERAIVTHPLVVRIVAEYVIAKGGQPVVSDSPPMGSFSKTLNVGEYDKAFRGLDVPFKPFETSVPVNIGEPFGHIELAEDALEADLVINLAKLKTHSQMLLTLGVKNLFGCIVGYKKPEWHLRAGIDRNFFAKLLVQIYRAISPAITIVDGILALEGQGPGRSGTPRPMGVLIGSCNAVEVDRAICHMIDLDPELLPTNRAARELGLLKETSLIQGDFNIVNDFAFPDQIPLTFGPKPLEKIMRRHLIQRPAVEDSRCKHCEDCLKFCPAKAITTEKNRIVFDYDRCIRCYCCLEICPHGALRARETLPGKIVRKITSFR